MWIDGDEEKLPVTTGDDDGPAEVELSNEDLSTSESMDTEAAAAAAAAAAEKKKQNRVPADKRINKLTREKMEALEYAAELERERDALREKATKLEQSEKVANKAALVHYETSVTANLASAKKAYSEAMASGDPDRIADANIELTKWASEKTEIDRFKASQPKDEPERQRQPVDQHPEPERQRQPAAPDLAPEAAKWATETAWFNPQNDGFNEDMHVEAVEFAKQLERRWARQGRGDEIGKSAEYFKAIEDHVRSEFPDEFGDEVNVAPARTPPMSAGRPDAAPAARAAVPAANGNGSGTRVQLTKDDVDMCKRYMTAGFYKDKNGKPIRDLAEAKRLYAIDKIKSERDAERQERARA